MSGLDAFGNRKRRNCQIFYLALMVRLQVLQGQDISENHSNPRSPYSNGACQIKVTSEMV